MKTTLVSTLIALFGFNAQAALIEGHFYANTCGDNEMVKTLQPINARILIPGGENEQTQVQRVCHGKLFYNGEFVETIRLYLAGSDDSRFVDFKVQHKFVEMTNDRSLLRNAIIHAYNNEIGTVEFAAMVFYKSNEVVSIRSPEQLNNTYLSFIAPEMEEVINITSIGQNNPEI